MHCNSLPKRYMKSGILLGVGTGSDSPEPRQSGDRARKDRAQSRTETGPESPEQGEERAGAQKPGPVQ